jgi:hypothetical protein
VQVFIDDTAALAWCADHEVVVHVETVSGAMEPYIVSLWVGEDRDEVELTASFRVTSLREAVERFIGVWKVWSEPGTFAG